MLAGARMTAHFEIARFACSRPDHWTTIDPAMDEPWIEQWYLYVPAVVNVRAQLPADCEPDDAPSSKTMLCAVQV